MAIKNKRTVKFRKILLIRVLQRIGLPVSKKMQFGKLLKNKIRPDRGRPVLV